MLPPWRGDLKSGGLRLGWTPRFNHPNISNWIQVYFLTSLKVIFATSICTMYDKISNKTLNCELWKNWKCDVTWSLPPPPPPPPLPPCHKLSHFLRPPPPLERDILYGRPLNNRVEIDGGSLPERWSTPSKRRVPKWGWGRFWTIYSQISV